MSSVALQHVIIGCASGLLLGLVYVALFAPIKEREAFFALLFGRKATKPGSGSGADGAGAAGSVSNVAQADGHRSALNEQSSRDAIALAESSYLTLPRHPLDVRYQLPEVVKLPASLARYLRV